MILRPHNNIIRINQYSTSVQSKREYSEVPTIVAIEGARVFIIAQYKANVQHEVVIACYLDGPREFD